MLEMGLMKDINVGHRWERVWLLAKMDFLQRYYGSSLGLLWAFINPLARLVVYYLVFSYLIFKNNEPKFILYLFMGIIVWGFFAEMTKRGMKAMEGKRYLLENVQINRLDIHFAHSLTVLYGFGFNLLMYLLFCIFFQTSFGWPLLWFLPLLAILYLFSSGVAMILSTVFIQLRDLDHVWELILLLGFWTVPIIWDQAFIFEHYQFMLYVTPITGELINFRNIFMYNQMPHFDLLTYDLAYALITYLGGMWFFNRFAKGAAQRR
jgi:ABC-type polysaccharide/polyol phosphate export permease